MIWCHSLEGGAFDLLNPTPAMIDWHTVANVLGRIPRFGGHTLLGSYSVAQHCVEGARAVLRETDNREWAAAFLLHDVHEAYIGDIMTPVAKALEALATLAMGCESGGALVKSAIIELKHRIDVAVYEKAGMTYPFADPKVAAIVKVYDYRMAVTERAARLAPYPIPWHPSIEMKKPIPDVDCTVWSADLATALWHASFREFFGNPQSIEIPAPSDCGGCDQCAAAQSDEHILEHAMQER